MNKEWIVVTSKQGVVIDVQPIHAVDVEAVKALIADYVAKGRFPKAKHDVYEAASFRLLTR